MAKRWLNSEERTYMTTMTKQKKSSPFNVSIPEHIMEEILLKLPPKSLSRFKCVSKSWNDRISDPSFARAHLQHNATTPPLIIGIDRWNGSMVRIGKEVGRDQLIMKELFSHMPIDHISLECSCDGILCIARWERDGDIELILWNPNIRKHKTLIVPKLENTVQQFGIGYDLSADDYKILQVIRKNNRLPSENVFEFQVLTMKSKRWRPVWHDMSYYRMDTSSRPLSLHGVMYWIAYGPMAIVCFDLANETFSAVPPVGCERILGLMELKGKVGFGTNNPSGHYCTDFWVMEDQTWVKLFTISDASIKHELVFGLNGDGAVFMHCRSDVTLNERLDLSVPSWWPSIISCGISLISFN